MKQKRLVLFDIDGTLLNGGHLWRECFEGALAQCFPGVVFPRTSFSGKTDRLICMEMMKGAGIWDESSSKTLGEMNARIDHAILDYLQRVRALIPSRAGEITVLPGVRQIIEALKTQEGVILGLLTGNVAEGAKLKLEAVELHAEFQMGVYGDDHWDRYELPAIAVKRAKEKYALEFRGKEIVIIGDTVHDVNCGQSLGVRSIAVGTGHSAQRTAILSANPDYFFPDLSQHEQVLESILSPR